MTVALLSVWGSQPPGTLYTSDAATEAAMIARGQATATLTGAVAWLPAEGSATDSTAVEDFGVSYSNPASVNVAAFNRALARRGVVTLSKPGQYMIGGPGQGGLLIPSRTMLVCAEGVELILAAATYAPLIRNAQAFDLGTALTGPIVYGGGGGSFTGTCSAPNIQLKHPVGSWIAILGLDVSNSNNRTYQGVYRVVSVGAGTITYEMIDIPPSGGNSTSGAIVYPADTGVRIFGGMWDGNFAGNNSGPFQKGDPNQWIIGLRNSQDTIVDGARFRRGTSWSAGANNVRDATFRNLQGDLFSLDPQATTIFQGTGGARNVLIENVSGTCEDNMVAWSLDIPATWTYQNHWAGDVWDLCIRNIHSGANRAATVNLWGSTNCRFHSAEISNVTGRSNVNAVSIDNGFSQTGLLNTRGGTLKIENVNASCGASPVNIRTDGDWDHIQVNGVQQRYVSAVSIPLVKVWKRPGGTVQTLRRLDISNLNHYQPGTPIDRTGALVEIGDSNIGELTVDGIPTTRINAATGLVNFIGTEGVVGRAVVSNVNGVAISTGDRVLVRCENTNAGALGTLVLRDSVMTGFDASGGLVHQTATGKVARVRIDNTPVPALVRAGNVGGVLRDGTGLTVDTVSVASL